MIFSWVLSVVDEGFQSKKLAKNTKDYWYGATNNLDAGGVGAGSTRLIVFDKSDVQSLGGLWNQKVKIQLGVIAIPEQEELSNAKDYKKIPRDG